jgi:hypothetical protein
MTSLKTTAVAIVLALAAATARANVISYIRSLGIATVVDSIALTTGASVEVVPTSGFQVLGGQTDTFQFDSRYLWPEDDFTVYYSYDGIPRAPWSSRIPVADTWYQLPAGDPPLSAIMFTIGTIGVEDGSRAAERARIRARASGGSVAFVLSLPVAGRAVVDVFDGTGRLVRTLADRMFGAGEHRLAWDRCNTRGRQVGAGIYLVRLSVGSSRSLAKLVLVD